MHKYIVTLGQRLSEDDLLEAKIYLVNFSQLQTFPNEYNYINVRPWSE